jgi:TatD DNase family protein
MNLIDAHCHLANLNAAMPLEPLLEEAHSKGITRFLSSALTKAEVHYHLSNPREGVLFSAGIHPNYDECDLDLADIARLCEDRRIWAIGEIGLDRSNPDLERQEEVLEQQLALAVKHRLPVVLHIVGHQQRAYEILSRYPLKYLVHGYAGSVEAFRLLSRLESWFTVSGRILRPDKKQLLREMVSQGRYLFETDITRHYVKQNEPNPLLRLLDVFWRASELSGVKGEELEQAQEASYRELVETLG